MFQTLKVLSTTEYSTKKPDKWKKHSVLKIVLTNFFGRNLVYVWFEICPSYLSRKKGTSGTFLSLGLFISWSRTTASTLKMRPRLQKTFPRFPFFYYGNLDKSQIRRRKGYILTSKESPIIYLLFEKSYETGRISLVRGSRKALAKVVLFQLRPYI